MFQMLQMRGVVASPSLALARRSPISQGREALWRRCGGGACGKRACALDQPGVKEEKGS